ncbi:MAG: prolipoprotein diacylglyceryl transferase [Gammaproteobacteria bacterium]|nr:prolipoprotein diacylglyceryl transferase [Gammaproteobacteria bacterium]
MIQYPAFHPVALQLGPLKIHWYGIMYLLGFMLAWGLARLRAKRYHLTWSPSEIEDLIFYAAVGVILGGRLGYMLFYNQGRWLSDPLSLLRIWEGGMSFHGGLLGVAAALYFFSKKHKRSFLSVADFTAPLVPLGLGLGRLGNFINAELWGRVTDVPWAMRFPHSDGLPRHPSQLYAMGLEGVVLFFLVWIYASSPRKPGKITGVFLMGYAVCRGINECFRQPDPQLGFIAFGWLTMGQLLSLPLLMVGCYLFWRKT